MENYEERLRGFIEREQAEAALQFLKGLEEKERKKFAPFLKSICKEYLELRDTGKYFRTKANEKQTGLIGCLLFVCSPRTDFERRARIWLITTKRINEILTWYRPSWFNDYINSIGSADGFLPADITYEWILELAANGHITPSPEIIVRTLPRYVFEEESTRSFIVKPEKVFNHEVTIREHIWYFFNTENFIYQADRQDPWGSRNEKHKTVWTNIFLELAATGKVDRIRLLSESILGTARNFNKPLTGWHADLFSALEATHEELLLIQSSLLNALNSNQSKPANIALNGLKKISNETTFDAKTFIEYIPLLLSSETKATVNSTLSLIEKVAKKSTHQRNALCVAVCQVFIHADADLQTKAAKLIEKYHDSVTPELENAISQYDNSILASARKILAGLLNAEQTLSVSEPPSSISIESSDRITINSIHSFDELLFLASQAFDFNQTYHIDVLAAALVEWNPKIKPEQVPMFEPALQRALKTALEGVGSTGGSLEYLLALFFIDYCRTVMGQHPVQAQSLTNLYITYTSKDTPFNKRIIPLKSWRNGRGGEIFNPIIDILLLAHEKTITADRFPLLSTPTHEPCYISPEVLIARLKQYAVPGAEPNLVDFQVAVSRCDLNDAERSLSSVDKLLSGEVKQLMMFLLNPSNKSILPVKYQSVWMAAALSKDNTQWPEQFNDFTYYLPNKFIAQYSWRSYQDPYQVNEYNYKTRQTVKVTHTRKRLEIDFDSRKLPEKQGRLRSLFSKLTGSGPKKDTYATIYDTIHIKPDDWWVDRHDVARLVYITPNNPEPMFAELLNVCFRENTLDARQQQLLSNGLEAILPLQFTYRKMGHLLIAASMLAADKTIQTFAAELWAKGVSNGKLVSVEVGSCIGEMQSTEFAPLKRFTDLISSSLINRSPYHNHELEKLLVEVLARLPVIPVTNLKKLLELYFELLSINKTKPPEKLLPLFKSWESSAGLKKILGSLQQV